MSDYNKIAAAIRGDMSQYDAEDLQGIKRSGSLMEDDNASVGIYFALVSAGCSEEEADRINGVLMEADDIAKNEKGEFIGRLKHKMMTEQMGELSPELGAFIVRYLHDVHGKDSSMDEEPLDDSVDIEELIAKRRAREQAEELEARLDAQSEETEADEEEEEEPKNKSKLQALFEPLQFEQPDKGKQQGIGTSSRVGRKDDSTGSGANTGDRETWRSTDSRRNRGSSTTTDDDTHSRVIEDYYDLLPGVISNEHLKYLSIDLHPAGQERLYKLLARYKALELATKNFEVAERKRILELIEATYKQVAATHSYGETEDRPGRAVPPVVRMGYRLADFQGLEIKDVSDEVVAEMFAELGDTNFERAIGILKRYKSATSGKKGNSRRGQEAAKLRKLFRFLPSRGRKGGTSYIASDFFGLGIEDVSDDDIADVFAHSEMVNMERLVEILLRYEEIKDDSGRGRQGERDKLARQVQAFVREFASGGGTGVTVVSSKRAISTIDALDAPGWIEIRTAALGAFEVGDGALLDQMIAQSEASWAQGRYGYHACDRLRRMIRHLRSGVSTTEESFKARYFAPRAEEAA